MRMNPGLTGKMNFYDDKKVIMTSISTINKTEYTLLQCLSQCLKQSDNLVSLSSLTAEEYQQLLTLADRHEVLSLLDNVWEPTRIPESQSLAIQSKTARTVHKAIQLQVLDARLTALLAKEGIIAVTLKGCTVARFYPVPEFRKTTDIDLFVADKNDAKRAVQILEASGFHPSGEWHANHHVILNSGKNEVVELHTTWADDFKDKHLNQSLERLQKESSHHCHLIDFQGLKVYAYETAWQGFYLMIHMLQHFVGSGFGLRNLCDWVVLWEHCDDIKEREEFWKMVCESGTAEFAKAVTAICVSYLGLPQEKSPIPAENPAEAEVRDALLRDILDAGEFGYSEAERMVGMDGDAWTAYGREFHHQMHINFPKAGKHILFWPALWLATLVRFLRNNKKLNRAPVSAIMKKAGKRGKLVRRLTS